MTARAEKYYDPLGIIAFAHECSDRDILDVEAVGIEGSDRAPAVTEGEESNSEGMKQDSEPNRQDVLLADNANRRCVAHKTNGEQCRKFAILGATVCRTHGGAARHVNRARVRVENAADRLMGKLIDFAFDDTKPPDVQLRAIRDALDRCGLKAPSEVLLSQSDVRPYEQIFDCIGGAPPGEFPSARGNYGPADDPRH